MNQKTNKQDRSIYMIQIKTQLQPYNNRQQTFRIHTKPGDTFKFELQNYPACLICYNLLE